MAICNEFRRQKWDHQNAHTCPPLWVQVQNDVLSVDRRILLKMKLNRVFLTTSCVRSHRFLCPTAFGSHSYSKGFKDLAEAPKHFVEVSHVVGLM